MQDSLPAGGLRLYREGVEPSGSLRKVSGYIPFSFPGLLLSQGWSMPSGRSPDPARCSPISAATPIASPSPTAGLPVDGRRARSRFRWKDYRATATARRLMTLDGRRVHPPLPDPCVAGRVPPHPPLRLPRQRPSRRQTRPLPQPARCTATGRLPAAPVTRPTAANLPARRWMSVRECGGQMLPCGTLHCLPAAASHHVV